MRVRLLVDYECLSGKAPARIAVRDLISRGIRVRGVCPPRHRPYGSRPGMWNEKFVLADQCFLIFSSMNFTAISMSMAQDSAIVTTYYSPNHRAY